MMSQNLIEFLQPLTQELCNNVNCLSPQEKLPIASTVTRKSFLTARILLFQFNKISWHIVILGYNRTPYGVLK